METENPYKVQIWNTLPRLLALFNTDRLSSTYGVGDRYRWAWKLIDFCNATFQGAANGLARLMVAGLLPPWLTESSILDRIDAIFEGTATLRYKNGSLAEAFPYESSFCVTALVAYDLLTTTWLLGDRLNTERKQKQLDIVRPMIRFLRRCDERHAFISNHLATAAAALYRWNELSDDADDERAWELLKRIIDNQSPEGWFREYDGADPGYQSLCTYYLSDIHLMRPDLDLSEPLTRSLQFLWHFAHPDGSFGGHYGSRNTRFYYPAGIEALAAEIPEAEALAVFMRASVQNYTTVTLATMDEPNLSPMFNAYCWSAAIWEARQGKGRNRGLMIPSLTEDIWQKHYSGAGLFIDKGSDHYTVVSLHKGGVVCHYQRKTGKSLIDNGVAALSSKNRKYTTQAYAPENDVILGADKVVVTSHFTKIHDQLPTSLQFVILRILNITIMRNITVGNWVKTFLVKLLITGKNRSMVKNRRTIHLGGQVSISDAFLDNKPGFRIFKYGSRFSAIHMASQGYWQRQDDDQ